MASATPNGHDLAMASVGEWLRTALTPIVVARNSLDFPLRRLIRLRRPVGQVEPAGIGRALDDLEPSERQRAEELVATYHLGGLVARGRRRDVRENLYYLELLTTAFAASGLDLPDAALAAIDVGVSDWFYAPALAAALRHWRSACPRRLEVHGFEIDPGQRFRDGRSREDWAAWHLVGLDGLTYHADDARAWHGQVDLAMMLFPFLFARDSDRWGLPRYVLAPADLLGYTWSLVRPGGALVVANQGEAEHRRQIELLRELGVEPVWRDRFECPFWSYDTERYLVVARKL